MIKTHPKFPERKLEQYQMMSQLPDCQVFETREVQIKDHHYYHDNFNIWNNPYQANKKNFNSFHAKNIIAEPAIAKRKELEVQERVQAEHYRRVALSQERDRELSRLAERRQERAALQLESQQPIMTIAEGGDSGFLHRTVDHKSNCALNGRANYLWNKMNKLSNKYIQQAINSRIIKMDEDAVKAIRHKLERDEEFQQIKEELRHEHVHQIRELFQQQHIKNHEWEKSLGLVPTHKPPVHICKTLLKAQSTHKPKTPAETQVDFRQEFYLRPVTSSQPSQIQATTISQNTSCEDKHELPSRTYRIESSFPNKYVDIRRFADAQNSRTNDAIERLAQPKKQHKSLSLVRNPLDRTEFKGLLVSEVDPITQNLRTQFNKTMLESSIVVRDTLSNSRPTTKTKSSMKIRDPAPTRQEPESERVMVDIDQFERVFKGKEKRIGFPNSQLGTMKMRFKPQSAFETIH